MTISSTRPSALLHTTGRDLKTLLWAVLPHIATDSPDHDELPDLTRVHIEANGSEVRFITSDRYTMAIVRHPLAEGRGHFTLAVPGQAVHDLAAHLRDAADVTLSIEEGGVTVAEEGRPRVVIPGYAPTFSWRRALARFLTPADAPTGRILINPRYLARLEPAGHLDEDAPMVIQMRGEHKAVIATLTTRFLALIMPIHDNGFLSREQLPDRPLDGWFDLLDEDEIQGGDDRD